MKRILIFLFVVGCAASTRTKTLNAALATTDTAAVAVPTYAHEHTEAMIAACKAAGVQCVVSDLVTQVGAFRAQVDKVTLSIDGLYRLIAIAALANDDISVANMLKAAAEVQTEITELKK